MTQLSQINAHMQSGRLEPVWQVRVELSERDDQRVRAALTEAVALQYGDYDSVAFEGATGMQFFRPRAEAYSGAREEVVEMPARVLSFCVPRAPEVLAQAVDAVRGAHSYEEPVIVVTEAWASRADDRQARANPNRWWNRGFEL